MGRIASAAGLGFAALVLLQGCTFFSAPAPFPSYGTEPQAAGDTTRPKRVREAAALRRFDVNGDGDVTKAELEQTLVADFKKDDLNGDGVLDAVEARALNERLRQERNVSPVFDWNADGQISFAEFATQWRTLFDRADREHDGIVTAGEIDGTGERTVPPRPLPPPEKSGPDVGKTRIAQ